MHLDFSQMSVSSDKGVYKMEGLLFNSLKQVQPEVFSLFGFSDKRSFESAGEHAHYQRSLSSASDPFHPVRTEEQGADFTLRR